MMELLQGKNNCQAFLLDGTVIALQFTQGSTSIDNYFIILFQNSL